MIFQLNIFQIVLISLKFKVFVSYEGKLCTYHENENYPGTCVLSNQCIIIIDQIVNYFDCGIKGNQILVCCPQKMEINKNLRKHEKKCREYHSLAFAGANHQCHQDKILRPNVEVNLAKPKEFPHMALIGYSDSKGNHNWLCGGTLISDRYILTAGHCLVSREFGIAKTVRLGQTNMKDYNTSSSILEDYNIEKIIPHPNYKISIKYNDIALLKLNRTVKFSNYIWPACLPNIFDDETGKVVIATGWTNMPNTRKRLLSKKSQFTNLEKIILEIFPFNECNKIYLPAINKSFRNGIIDNLQLCAGSRNTSMDTCQGHSGGPLQIYHTTDICMYSVIGIISFGYSCGHPGIPGVYTRVLPYVNWIESHVW